MSSSGTSITCEVGLQLIVPDRAPVPLVARLDYSVDDPYAIRAAFHVGDDEPVEWIFARELLTVGIIRETGEGDVRIWPSQDGKERMVNIALSSPFGQARFHAQVAPLSEFLHRTYELVPAGQESDYIDIDVEIPEPLR